MLYTDLRHEDASRMAYVIRNHTALIVAYEGDARDLYVPGMLGGCPVTGIAEQAFAGRQMKYLHLPEGLKTIEHHAFAGCSALTSLEFPQSLQRIGNYAFYNCLNITRVLLPPYLRSIGFGAFKNCESITEIVQERMPGHEIGMGSLLEELSHRIHVIIRHLDPETGKDAVSEARLTFTEHDYEAGEFTAAWNKQYDSAQIGSGKYMRYCIGSMDVDYHKYDEMFYVLLRGDPFETVLGVALDRLMYPHALTAAAADRYEAYVREQADQAVPLLIRAEALDRLKYLCGKALLTEETTDRALDLTAELGKPEFTSLLMDYRHQHFADKEESFEL